MAENPRKSVFPVGLLLEGMPCVVIGGGMVAARKCKSLLAAGARVTVVSPDLHADLADLHAAGRLAHVCRPFDPVDVDGSFLVFAATRDAAVNRDILRLCREQGIYACAVDRHWREGAFLTPASFRKDDLTVSVTTGGKSCRRARLIKNSLSRHVSMVESADLLVMGLSHSQWGIAQREAYHLGPERMETLAGMLMQVWGVHEFVLVDTCNRVELLAVVAHSPALEQVVLHILEFDHLDATGFYVKRGYDAFAHLSLLSAGLLSQIVGEHHIVSQLKMAFDQAVARGWAAGMMQQWLSGALHIAKEIRGDSDATVCADEVETLAVNAALSRWGGVPDHVTVIGSGTVGRGVVAQMVTRGASISWMYHRTPPVLPAEWDRQVTLRAYASDTDVLHASPVVFCASSLPGYVLELRHLGVIDPQHPVLIVDLGLPRNADPQLASDPRVHSIIHLDDLLPPSQDGAAPPADVLQANGLQRVARHKEFYDKLIDSFQGRNPQ